MVKKKIDWFERIRLAITFICIFFLIVSVIGIPFGLIIWSLEKQTELKKKELRIPKW